MPDSEAKFKDETAKDLDPLKKAQKIVFDQYIAEQDPNIPEERRISYAQEDLLNGTLDDRVEATRLDLILDHLDEAEKVAVNQYVSEMAGFHIDPEYYYKNNKEGLLNEALQKLMNGEFDKTIEAIREMNELDTQEQEETDS